MQRFRTRLRPHKAEIAAGIALVGLLPTIMLIILGLADGYNFVNAFWIGCAATTCVGLWLCWLWRAPLRSVLEGIVITRNIWTACVAFSVFVRDWREAILFSPVLTVALAAKAWLKHYPTSS